MSNINIKYITNFISLVLVQVVICSHINFLGYINPYIYIVYIILFPINTNRLLFICIAFLLGLTIDVFSDSGGVHAAASVSLAYARPFFLKIAFRVLYEHQNIKISNTETSRLLLYIVTCTMFHHLILFYLEIFNISSILLTLKNTLFSSVFTVFLSFLISVLFSRNRK